MIRQGLFKIQKAAEGQQIVTQGYESWPREGASWEHDVVTWKGCHRHSRALLAVPGRSLSFHPFFSVFSCVLRPQAAFSFSERETLISRPSYHVALRRLRVTGL